MNIVEFRAEPIGLRPIPCPSNQENQRQFDFV